MFIGIGEIVSALVTIAVSVVGWVINWRSTVRLNERTKAESAKANADREEDLRNMREQIAALNKQAESVSKQLEMERSDFDKPPFGDAEWVKDSVYQIRNQSSRRVVVLGAEADGGFPFNPYKMTLPVELDFNEVLAYVMPLNGNVNLKWRWADEPEGTVRSARRMSIKP